MGKPRIITETEKIDIITRLSNGESRRSISDSYHISWKTLIKFLEAEKISYTDYSLSENRIGLKNKYGINHYYFDEIDTVNKAYILGFLFADGTNIANGNYVCIQLQSEDGYILEQIKTELGCFNLPIKDIISTNITFPNDVYSTKEYYSKKIVINSVHMNERLNKLGMVHNKSKVVEFPTEVPENLFNTFLLGYFDGNGTICFNEIKKKSSYVGITTGSLKLCEQLQNFVSEKFNIKSTIQKRSTSYRWVIYDRHNCVRFLNYIYENHDMCLQRKYDKYKAFCEYVDRLSKEPFSKDRRPAVATA